MGKRSAHQLAEHWVAYDGGAYRLVAILLFVCLGGLVATTAAFAQTTETTPTAPPNVSADEVNAVARELWCPLCSGVRLDVCELKACEQMKEVIAIKLDEGENTASIRDYFVGQYGPQVLGEPPLEGYNWLAWLLPFVALGAGGYFLWTTVRRMARPTALSVAQAAANPTLSAEDQRKLVEELKRL